MSRGYSAGKMPALRIFWQNWDAPSKAKQITLGNSLELSNLQG
jgi:hypothetical protein